MPKGKLYVVTMYRFGDRLNHSYVLGAFTHKTRAEKRGEMERDMRGGKYMPECLELEPNQSTEDAVKVIIPLEVSPCMRSS